MFKRTLTRKFSDSLLLKSTENQAIELAKYAKNFLENGKPS